MQGTGNDMPPPPPSAPSRKFSDLPELGDDDPWAGEEPTPSTTEQPSGSSLLMENPESSDLTPLFEENFIGRIRPMTELRKEYVDNGNQVFVQQMDWLIEHGYVGIRRTKPDGDCLYRSLAFAYVERLLGAEEPEIAGTLALSKIEELKKNTVAQGVDEGVLDEFASPLVDLITSVYGVPRLTHSKLVDGFNEMYESNSIVWACRAFTSATIKADVGRYAEVLFDLDEPDTFTPMDPDAWCARFVDPMGKEADHIMIQALTAALGVRLRIAYLGGKSSGKNETAEVEFVEMGEGLDDGLPALELLYRPGHYDVLAKRATEYED